MTEQTITWKAAIKIALEYWGFTLLALTVVGLGVYSMHDSIHKPTKETPMKEHTKLLQPYRQRIEGILADIEGTLNQIDTGNVTMEQLATDIVSFQRGLAIINSDMSAAVISYALQAQNQTQPSDDQKTPIK